MRDSVCFIIPIHLATDQLLGIPHEEGVNLHRKTGLSTRHSEIGRVVRELRWNRVFSCGGHHWRVSLKNRSLLHAGSVNNDIRRKIITPIKKIN